MTKKDVVLEYLKAFCSADLNHLKAVMADKFHLKGPFYEFHSRENYISSLKGNLAPNCTFEIIRLMEEGQDVSVFYHYIKPDTTVHIAQLFRLSNDKISETILIFDSRNK